MNICLQRATKAYSRIGIQTRASEHDPHSLALLMFEGVLESVTGAQGALVSGDVVAKVRHIDRAVRILHEGLRTSLDLENGGEIAKNLAYLYDYCVLQLTLANAKNDPELLNEVAGLLKPVAEAWQSIGHDQSQRSDASSENAVVL